MRTMLEAVSTPARILIVDDEEEIRDVLMTSLEDPAFELTGSSNAMDALDKMRDARFSLVISDLRMPGLSGLDFLRTLKECDPDVPVILITGVRDLETAVETLRLGACDYITKPFDLFAIRRSVENALERSRLALENRCYQMELERLVRERTLELHGALKEIEEGYRFTLEALAAALDAREHETRAHSQRVREYASRLARQLGLAGDDLIHLGRGALLHDVGKIGVPDSILLKPGKLTPDEWVHMKRHPQVGYDILQSIRFLAPAAKIVLAHQERWDGTGYPNCLHGDEIPLGARIFAVVDTLDAMTSDRPYRKALSFQTAWEEVYRCSGSQFDPDVVEAFLNIEPGVWKEIHDLVNCRHQASEAGDVLCQR
ncbi:MAG: Response regulator [Acidobacteria bacterium]|nr:Response regulator [Acidobacteriota bacterium]